MPEYILRLAEEMGADVVAKMILLYIDTQKEYVKDGEYLLDGFSRWHASLTQLAEVPVSKAGC